MPEMPLLRLTALVGAHGAHRDTAGVGRLLQAPPVGAAHGLEHGPEAGVARAPHAPLPCCLLTTSTAGPRGYRRPVSGLRQYASPPIRTCSHPASAGRRLSSS